MRQSKRKRERVTRIKRRTYAHTMSDSIAEHWYRRSETKGERERQRQITTDQGTYIYIYTYNK